MLISFLMAWVGTFLAETPVIPFFVALIAFEGED